MTANRFSALVFTGVWISCALTLLVGMSACSFDPCNPGHGIHACTGASPELDDEQGGGDGTVLDLPFAEGTSWRCTQGAHGTYSHEGTSTEFGIDLDTPNDAQAELYAPVGGTAYVHEESAGANFGYHVNVDVGGGRYVVLGHFSEVFVTDGAEVAAGQLVGYEGCTGACSGDHSHVGLMEGDPSLMAQYGTSVDVSFYALDTNASDGAFGAIAAEDFVCGTTDGHVYESALPVNLWHPDGTLVKVPDSPSVYLVEGGKARHVADETAFWSYNFDFDDLALISDEELSCLGTGEEITSEGSIVAAYGDDETAWLLVEDTDGSRWKQKVPSVGREDVLQSWGTGGDDLADKEAVGSGELSEYETRSGTLPFRDGSILKEESRSDVYVVSDGIALPVKDWDTYLRLGYGVRPVRTVGDGEVGDVMGDNVGSCAAGIWCLDEDAATTCGGGLELGAGSEAGGGEASEDTGAIDDGGDEGGEEDTGSGDEPVDDTDVAADTGSDEAATEDTGTETPVDSGGTASTDEWSDYVWIDGDDLCFSADGFAFPYDASDAYAVGYGGRTLALDFTFQEDFRLSNAGDAYCLDTRALDLDDYEVTLVSSLTSSGSAATSYADTGDWWDNDDLCASGTDTADRFCAWQGGWDYLVAFTVDTTGLHPNGDGA